MSEETLEALCQRLRGLAEKATPGPWSSHPDSGDECDYCGEPVDAIHSVIRRTASGSAVAFIDIDQRANANSALIAACDPSTILRLLEAAERVGELEKALRRIDATGCVNTLGTCDGVAVTCPPCIACAALLTRKESTP